MPAVPVRRVCLKGQHVGNVQPQQGEGGEEEHRHLPRVCHRCVWGWLCFFSPTEHSGLFQVSRCF